MAKATTKTGVVGLVLFVLVLILVPVLVAGCSGGTTTTTTTEAITTTTSSTVLETTTSTTEAVTTTTAVPGTAAVMHQQTDSRFSFSGTWATIADSAASGKSFVVTNAAGSSVTIRFSGTSVSWIAKKSPAYGQAKVTVDGGAAKTVDLYSATTAWRRTVWKSDTLAAGAHTVVISWTGKKSAGATATNINVDAVIVAGVVTGLFQEDNVKLSYVGSWKKTTATAASKGSFVSCDEAEASVTLSFTGIELVWMARTGPSYGQASVTVDGGTAQTVDLYSAAIKSKQSVWDTGLLQMGTHTITIERLGTKNASATGTSINVDAFDVTGVLN